MSETTTRAYPKRDPFTRFRMKYRIENDCWIWLASTNQIGMPMFSVGGRTTSGRNWIFEVTYRVSLTRDARLRTTCGHVNCVNPHHLELRGPPAPYPNAKKRARADRMLRFLEANFPVWEPAIAAMQDRLSVLRRKPPHPRRWLPDDYLKYPENKELRNE